jgi:hypothetical protein
MSTSHCRPVAGIDATCLDDCNAAFAAGGEYTWPHGVYACCSITYVKDAGLLKPFEVT